MPSKLASSATNRLLAAVPHKDRMQILANCEPVELTFADILGIPHEPVRYAYFPIDSIISLVMPITMSPGLEIKLIGNEGMLGIPLILGVDVAPFHALVQGPGHALRIAAPLFIHELERSASLQKVLKRYLYVSVSQLAQTAACNRFHEVAKRLARLLLMIRDRAHADTFHITQELLARMLGVRRVGVTKAAGLLQQQKLISYSRGNVSIHDITGLEAASCSCYQTDKDTYERILHH